MEKKKIKSDFKKQLIKDKNKVLAIILRNGNYPAGLTFYNSDRDFVQVGTWHYQKGFKVKAHRHKVFKRIASRTQEVIMVKQGKMRVEIFNNQDKKIKNILLKKGEVMIYLAGGHAFEILENNTQIFEVKNGPFLGVAKDKKIIK